MFFSGNLRRSSKKNLCLSNIVLSSYEMLVLLSMSLGVYIQGRRRNDVKARGADFRERALLN